MDKIKPKQYFIDNFNSGSLYIEKELLRYNGTPLICICKDTENNLYLTHCYEDWKNFSCLITKIDEVDLCHLAIGCKPYLIFEKSKELYNFHNETLTKLSVEAFKKLDVINKDFEYTEDIRKSIENYANSLFVTSDEDKKRFEYIVKHVMGNPLPETMAENSANKVGTFKLAVRFLVEKYLEEYDDGKEKD